MPAHVVFKTVKVRLHRGDLSIFAIPQVLELWANVSKREQSSASITDVIKTWDVADAQLLVAGRHPHRLAPLCQRRMTRPSKTDLIEGSERSA